MWSSIKANQRNNDGFTVHSDVISVSTVEFPSRSHFQVNRVQPKEPKTKLAIMNWLSTDKKMRIQETSKMFINRRNTSGSWNSDNSWPSYIHYIITEIHRLIEARSIDDLSNGECISVVGLEPPISWPVVQYHDRLSFPPACLTDNHWSWIYCVFCPELQSGQSEKLPEGCTEFALAAESFHDAGWPSVAVTWERLEKVDSLMMGNKKKMRATLTAGRCSSLGLGNVFWRRP